MKNVLSELRWLAHVEGITYLSFAVTMPLKYYLNMKSPNMYVGTLHGILFIAYCLWVLRLQFKAKLSWKVTGLLLIASLVPFMTFWVDKKYLKPMALKGSI